MGESPVTVPFLFYGTREILVRKDGFASLRIAQPVRAPWYQWFPLDLFSEHLWPGTIIDERNLSYEMNPTE